MPKRGKARVTDAQRQQIAAGRLAGKTSREIAAQTGLADDTVRHHAVDPRTQSLIQELKAKHHADFVRIFAKIIKKIEKHINSADPDVCRRGYIAFLRYMEAGEAPLARLEVTDRRGDFTLEELLATMRAAEEQHVN